MDMDNYMKLEISALSQNEGFARNAVAAFALCLNPTLPELSDVKTAVSEAVTNCIVHAYRHGDGKDMIVIECRAECKENGGILHITVSDEGCGIANVERAIEPFFTTLDEEERSGMGFTIMQTFMDGFHVDSVKGQGTKISMFRRMGRIAPFAGETERERNSADA